MDCPLFGQSILVVIDFYYGIGVSIGTITSTVGDGGTVVGTGVSVGMTAVDVASTVDVGGGGCVDVGVEVAGMVVGDAEGINMVAVAVNIAVGDAVKVGWVGMENSTCNSGAPEVSPSNDFATRLPDLPVTIMTREFPEFQLA